MSVHITYRASNPATHTSTTTKNDVLLNSEIDGNFKSVKEAIERIQNVTVTLKEFGAVGDGVKDDTAAVQNFFDYVVDNGVTGIIDAGVYRIKSKVTITVKTKGFKILGAGVDASKFVTNNTFVGVTPIIHVAKQTAAGFPGYEIGGFSILDDGISIATKRTTGFAAGQIGSEITTGGVLSNSATCGIQFGNDTVAVDANGVVTDFGMLEGYAPSSVHNIHVANTRVGMKFIHTRLLTVSRCSVWNNNVAETNIGIHITHNGVFCGDIVFDNCNIVTWYAAVVGATGSRSVTQEWGVGNKCVYIQSTGTIYNPSTGNGAIAGVKFRSCTFYSGQEAVSMYADGGSLIADVWFDSGCQIDQAVGYGIRGIANNDISRIADVNINSTYINLAVHKSIAFYITGTLAARIYDINITGCLIQRPVHEGILFYAPGQIGTYENTIMAIKVTNNTFTDPYEVAGGSVMSFTGVDGFLVSGNTLRQGEYWTGNPWYFMYFGEGCSDFNVTDNNDRNLTAVAAIMDVSSGNVRKEFSGNMDTDYTLSGCFAGYGLSPTLTAEASTYIPVMLDGAATYDPSFMLNPTNKSELIIKQTGIYTMTGSVVFSENATGLRHLFWRVKTPIGSGATASTPSVLSGVVQNTITVTNGGSGYTTAPAVSFTGGGGTGAAATATVVTAVTSPVITNGGSGYTTAPTVSFTGGGGTGAAATAIISGGRVTAINVTNGGSGYTTAPTVSFTGGGGTGAAATVSVGRVTAINVTNGGSGYTTAPTVTLVSAGEYNGPATPTFTSVAESAGTTTINGSYLLKLNHGDAIQMTAFQTSGATLTIDGSKSTMTLTKVY